MLLLDLLSCYLNINVISTKYIGLYDRNTLSYICGFWVIHILRPSIRRGIMTNVTVHVKEIGKSVTREDGGEVQRLEVLYDVING